MAKRNKEKRSTSKIFIFTEGEKTEINYIKGYIKAKNYPMTRFVLRQPENHVPYGLLKEVRKTKKKKQCKFENGDIIWLVFDRDKHDRIPATYDEARNVGKIGIAFSAICFEVWLMLHFHNKIGPFSSCDELRADKRFSDYIKDYEKNTGKIFDEVGGLYGLETAMKNAEKLIEEAEKGNPGRKIYEMNPYCNIHLLIKTIEEFFDDEKELNVRLNSIKELTQKSIFIQFRTP
ncbi:MAG: hypothetical protein A2017_11225 [Lentisphaerae bacterium GWF2_44_16]|nr:MAG: hypothetical protein A2017_11225 [Lentisphaerae bacterium GWF2_44_16]